MGPGQHADVHFCRVLAIHLLLAHAHLHRLGHEDRRRWKPRLRSSTNDRCLHRDDCKVCGFDHLVRRCCRDLCGSDPDDPSDSTILWAHDHRPYGLCQGGIGGQPHLCHFAPIVLCQGGRLRSQVCHRVVRQGTPWCGYQCQACRLQLGERLCQGLRSYSGATTTTIRASAMAFKALGECQVGPRQNQSMALHNLFGQGDRDSEHRL
mmetsp:Transcript_49406/g.110762  ORF Transcript_49406/g.110762 Transcript_49406/m.110762 type:complete len:207 (-) Transcript_49406:550-1170(-)